MPLIFLDYLDYNIKGGATEKALKSIFQTKLHQFAWDILAFPEATFLVAAPAIAKCKDTAMLMKACESMWKSSRIKYVLSGEYDGNFNLYVANRLKKLENNFTDIELNSHFEHRGYISNHWSVIFNDFLQKYRQTTPFISREKDCDKEFREHVKNNIVTDTFAKQFPINTNLNIEKSLIDIEDQANNNSELFQRESIVNKFMEHLGYNDHIGLIEINSALDKSFAAANASAALATTPSNTNRLDGNSLSIISKNIYIKNHCTLFELICRLTIDDCNDLSRQKPWELFVDSLNEELKKLHHADSIEEIAKSLKITRRYVHQKYILSVIISFFLSSVLPSGDAGKYASSILTDLPSNIASLFHKTVSKQLVNVCIELVEFVDRYYYTKKQNYFQDYNKSLQYFSRKGIFIQATDS
ncbi:hypothetical protein UWK_00461 [Desulfocapsa sulfexigens DSM 10523]|uniref:Uncharacterized protein n=1 Tax=Desulfocapsa sulfexigens (strain DSM 10523 / SB164P1) TaxID=1167006 RepID=M1NB72_DESSD|nr:hypothetical protein [Desulfocapsa sulfexigens]AGF77044.1 hypothetical protein UWK_00461 [Desulfocapsa sulfexigens DSM 10523]